ncbi:MAG: hypothetical protein LPK85_04795, partial [Gammaproteobacteria bacterium]|nr:hypothetical protein [Gammaproteobacteria bacterium]
MKHSNAVLSLSIAICMAGCGGSSHDNAAPSGLVAPELTITAVPDKMLRLAWQPIARATEFRVYEDRDGLSGFTEIARLPANTTEYTLNELLLPTRDQAQYRVEACDAQDCRISLTQVLEVPLENAAIYIKSPQPDAGNMFGGMVSMSGDGKTLAVTEAGADTPGASNTGRVHIYKKQDQGWALDSTLHPDNPEPGGYFGLCTSNTMLSSDGNTLVISDNHRILVYRREGQEWLVSVLSDDAASCAMTLSRDGSTVALVAKPDAVESENPRVVEVHRFDGQQWTPEMVFDLTLPEVQSLALTGDGRLLAVGNFISAGTVPLPVIGTELSILRGNVDIYRKSGNDQWAKETSLRLHTHENSYAGNCFGRALAFSAGGERLFVSELMKYYGSIPDSNFVVTCDPNIGYRPDVHWPSGNVHIFEHGLDQEWLKLATFKTDQNPDIVNAVSFGTTLS